MIDRDFMGFMSPFFLFCVSIFFFMWGCYAQTERECLEYGEMTGYEVRQLSSGKCMVNHPDEGWIPAWSRR